MYKVKTQKIELTDLTDFVIFFHGGYNIGLCSKNGEIYLRHNDISTKIDGIKIMKNIILVQNGSKIYILPCMLTMPQEAKNLFKKITFDIKDLTDSVIFSRGGSNTKFFSNSKETYLWVKNLVDMEKIQKIVHVKSKNITLVQCGITIYILPGCISTYKL